MELACRESSEEVKISRLLMELDLILSSTLSELSALRDVNVSRQQDVEVLDPVQFDLLMLRLKSLLEDDDTDATCVIDEMNDLSGISKYASTLGPLTKAIEAYDFEKGLELLRELKI